MRIISTIVLLLGCLALSTTVTAAAAPAPSQPTPRSPVGVNSSLSGFDTPPSAAPHHYIKMYRRTTGYVRPTPSAPPLPMTQPPTKGSLHRAFKMPKLPPSFQMRMAQAYSKKRKWGRMMNGN